MTQKTKKDKKSLTFCDVCGKLIDRTKRYVAVTRSLETMVSNEVHVKRAEEVYTAHVKCEPKMAHWLEGNKGKATDPDIAEHWRDMK